MENYLSIADATIRLRRPRSTVQSMALQGRLGPVSKLVGRYVVTVEGVEAFIKAEEAAKAVA